MKQFFKFVFASFFGTILAFVLGSFLITFIIGIVASSFSDKEKHAEALTESTLFVPELSKPISERDLDDGMGNFQFDGNFGSNGSVALVSIVKSIEAAKNDVNVKAMYLDLTVYQGGRASMEAIKDALRSFKTSGKPIYAYADYYNEATYYLAAMADSIFMQPTGDLSFDGALMEMMFFRGTFDKLEIDPRVIKHGKYKSAGEPFSETKMSKYNRIQMRELLHSLYTQYLNELSISRGIDSASLRSIASNLKVRKPQDAVDLGLIDGLKYRDQMLKMLAQTMGVEKYEDVETTTVEKYMGTIEDVYTKDKVAIVYAVGSIEMGEGDDETIGSNRISEAIREAREDEKVKAIVLRVNSPGGSALASDIILREMELCKKAGKPVVVSMGDVAASGGYYISCKADVIVAEPSTITGSIGVIGIIPGTQKFFENKLGITFDRIKTGPFADLGNPNRDMSDTERKIIQDQLDRIYIDFISHVAEGRSLDTAFVNKNGQGRVWTGIDAQKLGLVDELGGLDKAIAIAVERAQLEEYQIKEFPKVKNQLEELIKSLGGNVKAEMIKAEIGEEQYKLMQQVKWLTEFDEPMMLMPYFFH